VAARRRSEIPLRELRFSFSRSSGPGGQNVNRVATKARLHWDVTRTRALDEGTRARLIARWRRRVNARGELVVTSQRFRDRSRNVADCLEKLRAMLEWAATPPKRRRPTSPGRSAVERRLAEKRRRGLEKRRRARPRPNQD
jgi:ribosome-associated protein